MQIQHILWREFIENIENDLNLKNNYWQDPQEVKPSLRDAGYNLESRGYSDVSGDVEKQQFGK